MNVIIANRYSAMLQGLDIDVIKRLDGEFEAEDIINKFQNFYFQRMILDITAIKDYKDIKNIQKLSIALDMDKVILLLDDTPETATKEYLSKLISMGIYNFTKNAEGIKYLYDHPNSYRDVAQYHQLETPKEEVIVEKIVTGKGITKVIGVKNINESAGSTSFVYMMKKQLVKNNYTVAAIEVDSKDSMFFRDKDYVNCTDSELATKLATFNDRDVILIDMNKSKTAEVACHEVIYLLEPSMVKLNRLLAGGTAVLANLKNKKIVLNQSLLTSKDVLDFEYESGLKVFYNMPPLDERDEDINAMDPFLAKLGFIRSDDNNTDKKNNLLGLFNI